MTMNNMTQLEDDSYTGYFVGKVVSNDDPLRKQRVKVKIQNLLDAPIDQLPWFAPIIASGFGNSASANVLQVPTLGSMIVVMFQNGDVHYGLYVGYADSQEVQVDPELLTHYPERRGWKDPAGHMLIIDTSSGGEVVEFRHKSGTKIVISPSGDLEVTSVGNTRISTSGTMSIQSGGDMSLQSGTHIGLTAPRVDVAT